MDDFYDAEAIPPPIPRPTRTPTSAVKAGWICIGLGFLTCWTLIGFVFFSVAMILGIVAMCSNRIGEGIAILVSAIGSLFLCGLILMGLLFGTVAVGVAKAADEAKKHPPIRQQSLPSWPTR